MTASETPPTPRRCLAVWGVTTVAVGALDLWLLWPAAPVTGARPALRFEDLLVAGCELAVLAATAWLWLLVSLVVVDLLRGLDAAARLGVPKPLRRAVLAACGLSLAGCLAAPAHAGETTPRPEAVAELLVGLPLPDRATSTTTWVRQASDRTRPTSPDPVREGARPEASVRVRPGDTLWALAATTLPADADDAEVDRRWREIYRHNRSAIGADPDLIRPGQRLLLPPGHSREEP